MDLIRSSAFLLMCSCGRHAQIIYSDQSRSLNFGSREAGLDIIEQVLKDKKITAEEGCAVIGQIMSSPLPTERGRMDMVLNDIRTTNVVPSSLVMEVFLSVSRPTDQSVCDH